MAAWVNRCVLSDDGSIHNQELDDFGSPKFTKEALPKLASRNHDVEEFVGVVRRYGDNAQVAKLIEATKKPAKVSNLDVAQACGTCIGRAAEPIPHLCRFHIMAKLNGAVQRFILQALACYETRTQTAEEFVQDGAILDTPSPSGHFVRAASLSATTLVDGVSSLTTLRQFAAPSGLVPVYTGFAIGGAFLKHRIIL